MTTQHFFDIFNRSVRDYQEKPDVNRPMENPFAPDTVEAVLYHKNWIDNVQWDLEDLIRNPDIDPAEALLLKRSIDKSNQERTDRVEQLDDYFLAQYKNVVPNPDARLNTESIAWALDRLSILALKLYHMGVQTGRTDASEAHINKCQRKLTVLEVQKKDLIRAIDELMEDIAAGRRIIKSYRQMKMYNDPSMNPVLYQQKKGS